jgi:hypothetical protein
MNLVRENESYYINYPNNANLTNDIYFLIDKKDIYNQNYESILKFAGNHLNIDSDFDKLFVVCDKFCIQLKQFENLTFGFINFSSSFDENFISYNISVLNILFIKDLQDHYNEKFLKHLEKKLILFLNQNLQLNNYYKYGPITNHNVSSTFNFTLTNSYYNSIFYEYSMKVNQYIFNNLPKDIQLQKQKEKQALKELSKCSHTHKNAVVQNTEQNFGHTDSFKRVRYDQ